MKLPLFLIPGQSCSYLRDASGQYIAKSITDTDTAVRELELLRDAANLSTELPAVQVNAKLLRACELALEVIRRHDAGEIHTHGDYWHDADFALDFYCGRDGLTDSDGVQGIGDVLRDAITEAKSQPAPEKPVEMALCEVPHLFLRPDQLYRFTVRPGCKACETAAAPYVTP